MYFNPRSLNEGIACAGYNPKNLTADITPYYGQDHNYTDGYWQGENPATDKVNYPAILAARTSGGIMHPQDINNGINKTWNGRQPMNINEINPKFRKLWDNGREEDALSFNEYYDDDVCSKLSAICEAAKHKRSAPRRQPKDNKSAGGKGVLGKIWDATGVPFELAGRAAGAVAGGATGLASHIPGLRSVVKGYGDANRWSHRHIGDDRYQ